MTRRRLLLVLGLALVLLLALGVEVAVLWPNEAELKAAAIQAGMPYAQARAMLGPFTLEETSGFYQKREDGVLIPPDGHYLWVFSDGSRLTLRIEHDVSANPTVVRRVETITPPTRPVHSLTRLRRTLARALPFLGE
jgi:hypothetical protein